MEIRIKVKFTEKEKEIIKELSPELIETIEKEESESGGWSEWELNTISKLIQRIHESQKRLP